MVSSTAEDISEPNIDLAIEIVLQSQQLNIKSPAIEQLQKVFFRIIADNHSGFSIEGYQKIVGKCMAMSNIDVNFDDGSECYTSSLLDELREFNTKHFKEFRSEF